MPVDVRPYSPGLAPQVAEPAMTVYVNDELNRIGATIQDLLLALGSIDLTPPDTEEPQGLVPPGSIVGWPANVLPGPGDHWIHCDGALLLVAEWPQLFAVIGATYGGDGVTDFAIPQYEGEFLRGTARGSGSDPDTDTRTDRGDGTVGNAVGTRQLHAVETHTHNYQTPTAGATQLQVAGDTNQGATITGPPNAPALVSAFETRARNVYVNWFMYAGVPVT